MAVSSKAVLSQGAVLRRSKALATFFPGSDGISRAGKDYTRRRILFAKSSPPVSKRTFSDYAVHSRNSPGSFLCRQQKPLAIVSCAHLSHCPRWRGQQVRRLTVDSKKESQEKPLSLWAKFKLWARPFVEGTKGLYADMKRSRELTRRQASGQLLSRSELLHLRRTRNDVITALPLVAFFVIIPWVGYIAPLLGYKYPKLLLSRQFWTPEQEEEFMAEDYFIRTAAYDELLDYLRRDLLVQKLLKAMGEEATGELSGTYLKTVESIFNTGGPFALDSLSRDHLLSLSRATLVPKAQFTAIWLPSLVLQSMLRKRWYELSEDDVMLIREGLSTLSTEDLRHALFERGLDYQGKTHEQLERDLEDWLSVYTVSSAPTALPPSLTLHMPVFKAHRAVKPAPSLDDDITSEDSSSVSS